MGRKPVSLLIGTEVVNGYASSMLMWMLIGRQNFSGTCFVP